MRYIRFYQKNDKNCHREVTNNGRQEMEGEKSAMADYPQQQFQGAPFAISRVI
jgi:hypothetical protein